jgi:hypothetical protein
MVKTGHRGVEDDWIRLEPAGTGEWLVVPAAEARSEWAALALIRHESVGYACYPNTVGYGRLGPYPTLDAALDALAAHLTT